MICCDHLVDLVDRTAVGRAPVAPLRAVNAAEVAVRVRPLVPDGHAVLVEILDVGVAAQKPEQFVDDGFEVHFFGREQRKALASETHLGAEHGKVPVPVRSDFLSMLEDMPQEFEILAHGGVRQKYFKEKLRSEQQAIIAYFKPFLRSSHACFADANRFPNQSIRHGNAHSCRAPNKAGAPAKTADKTRGKAWYFLGKSALEALLSRRKMDLSGIGQAPAAANLESGALCVWVAVDLSKSPFEQQTLIRKAVQPLLEESPA